MRWMMESMNVENQEVNGDNGETSPGNQGEIAENPETNISNQDVMIEKEVVIVAEKRSDSDANVFNEARKANCDPKEQELRIQGELKRINALLCSNKKKK